MCVLVASSAFAQAVPLEFRDLHDDLFLNLSDFRNGIHETWDGTGAPVAFSANLMAAHSFRGDALLAPGMADGIALELDGLKALGVRAITLSIDFPMLYRPFHGSDEEYQRYLALYAQLAGAIRARGLTLIVESAAIFSDGMFTPWDVAPYYAGLTLAEYQQGRMEVARTIATELGPDYLSVITEPDTEATQSGKPEVGTVEGSRALLDVILTGLRDAAVPGVAVGAGVGTWQQAYRSYVDSFASTAIDFVDMHIYPSDSGYLVRALEIADVAASYGKQVGMTETWTYKASPAEHELLPPAAIFRRDVFSFWTALDSLHVRTMVDLAHFKRFAFISPFWSGYLRGYVDYTDATKDLPWPALSRVAQAEWSRRILDGQYSATGLAYRDALIVPPDVTPPTRPDLTVQLTAADAVALMWSPTTDGVGTAAYLVWRDGEMIGRTVLTQFLDGGLAEARPYLYSVIAMDASNNASPPAFATITTPDITPPSLPQNLTAAVVAGANRLDVTLSWLPASDNVGVTQYVVTRGTSPDAMTPIAATTTNLYTIGNERPDTKVYYGVRAIDAGWNVSTEAVTNLTTPLLPDVTPPVVRITYPADGATVTRNGTLYLYGLTYDIMGGSYDVPSGPVALRFFIDGVPVGNELTTPYIKTPQYSVFELQTPTPSLSRGDHLLTAVARDAAGNTATSAAIRIRVSR